MLLSQASREPDILLVYLRSHGVSAFRQTCANSVIGHSERTNDCAVVILLKQAFDMTVHEAWTPAVH